MTSPYPVNQPTPSSSISRTVDESLVPERGGANVWLSNIVRDGDWIFARLFRAFAFMGNVEIDLTSARMGAGISEIEVLCILANVEIRVPPDIRVECDGDGIAGDFGVTYAGERITPPFDAPTLRVSGTAYLGSVTVKILGPPGPGWKTKLKAGWQSFNS